METERKFINPTPGWVGAVKINHKGEAHGLPVEPGGFIWLTSQEERLTAEAPRLPQDNPFVAEWFEPPADWDGTTEVGPGNGTRREGTLVLAQEPARPLASDRYTPAAEEPAPEPEPAPAGDPEEDAAGEPERAPEEITGAPEIPTQPPVEGKPAPDEVVGTPDAPEKNNEHVAAQRAKEEADRQRREEPQPVGEGGPRPASDIGVKKDTPALV